MNTDENNIDDTSDDDTTVVGETAAEDRGTDGRPLGYWLRAVDALLTHEFAKAFEAEGVTRRDWMLLHVLSGDVEAPGIAERLARKGKRLRGLEDRGWVVEIDGAWALTDEGRAATERLGSVVGDLRSRVSGAVSPEDYATTMASLEAIARELGWDENTNGRGFGRRGLGRPPFGRRGFGPGFDGAGFEKGGSGPGPMHPGYRDGFGPNLHRGFPSPWGPGHGPDAHHEPAEHADGGHAHGGHGHGGEHGHAGHAHGGHCEPGHRGHGGHGRGHHRRGRHAERAYERGFDAGFARGREAHDA